jgi:hypothetical protein
VKEEHAGITPEIIFDITAIAIILALPPCLLPKNTLRERSPVFPFIRAPLAKDSIVVANIRERPLALTDLTRKITEPSLQPRLTL